MHRRWPADSRSRIAVIFTKMAVYCLSLVLVALRPCVRVRVGFAYSSRFGHLFWNQDLMALETTKGERPTITVLLWDYKREARHEGARLVRTALDQGFLHLVIHRLPFLSSIERQIGAMSELPTILGEHFIDMRSYHRDVSGARPAAQPLISSLHLDVLKEELSGPVNEYLTRCTGKVLVALVVRDWTYHGVKGDDFRNPPIESFIPMVEFLIQSGFAVVRLGRSQQAFPFESEFFMDQAIDHEAPDSTDLYLGHLACTHIIAGDGYMGFSAVQRKRIIFVNETYLPFLPSDSIRYLHLPARLFYKQSGRLLKIDEMASLYEKILQDPHLIHSSDTYNNLGIGFAFNSESDIVAAVKQHLRGSLPVAVKHDVVRQSWFKMQESLADAALGQFAHGNEPIFSACFADVYIEKYADLLCD